ncbi:transmembrane protein, putative [Medicago truncatula]|uniref:Transmembrane protein, putative n=1 Tax=Medicago truncatula TaxID=3880 RepID=A0A072U1T7_MEDTR|nr:transmembrane protein, putative [Medicago truncatula]
MVVVVCCWILVAGSGLKHCAEMMMKNCVCVDSENDCELVIKTILLLGEEHDRLFLWLGEEHDRLFLWLGEEA